MSRTSLLHRVPAVLLVALLCLAGCTDETPRGGDRLTNSPTGGRFVDPTHPSPTTGPAVVRQAPVNNPWLRDVALASGIDFTHANGAGGDYQLPEIMGSGCAWIDYDLDGDLDAYLLSGGHDPSLARNRLYRNNGNGSFVDVTDGAGVGDPGFGMGVAVGDHDLDGHPDLYVTNFGPNVLYRNSGDGTFMDVTARAGVGDPRWGAAAAFTDIDGDGDLDLFVTNYMKHPVSSTRQCADGAGRREYCGPHSHFPPDADTLFRNEGNGTFVDISRESGIAQSRGYGLGVLCADFSGDGHLDIYVANDAAPNSLWIGDGVGHFTDRAVELGAAFNQHGQPEAGMGVQAEDVDVDGILDLVVTNLVNETNTLYRGRQDGAFEDVTHATGLAAPSLPMTGFGVGFLDADLDGDLDLIVTNGRVRRGPRVDGVTLASPWNLYAQRDQFFEHMPATGPLLDGAPSWRLEDRSREAGLAGLAPHLGRGLALGDYDNDGDVDVLVTACGGRARLYRNEAPRRGHWLTVHVVREGGKGTAYGARVSLTVLGVTGVNRTRVVQPASSYLSSNDPRLHFGLGSAETAAVTVRWTDGTTTELSVTRVDRFLVVEKGRGELDVAVAPAASLALAQTTGGARDDTHPERDSGDGSRVTGDGVFPATGDGVFPDPRDFEQPLRGALHKGIAAVKSARDDAQAWGELAMLCHAHGLHASARRAYRRAGELDALDALWPHLRGLVCDLLSLHDEAIEALGKSIEMEDYDFVARCALARIYTIRGEHDRARELYLEVVKKSPKSVAARVGLGQLAARAGALEMAVRNLRQALAEFPRCGPAHAALSRVYERLGKTARAKLHRRWSLATGNLIPLPDQYIDQVQVFGVSYTARMRLGNLARGQGKWKDAAEHFRAAVAIREDLVGPRFLLGRCLARAGDVDAGLAELGKLAAGEERRVDAWLEIARIHAGKGDLAAAHAAVAKAVEADPRSAEALVMRGNLHRRENKSDAARSDYDLALVLEPEYARAHVARGRLLHVRGASREDIASDQSVREAEQSRARDALASFDRALELEADLVEAYEGAGRVHMKLWELEVEKREKREHLALAIQRFMQAVEFFPERKGAHIALIRALHAAGLHDETMTAIQAARKRWRKDPRFRKKTG